uniref:Adenylate kinase active site lid domain-containing protein n=2 Tax=Neobodo designis TaxID=312471 RepID=A0A7S1L865_NEODS
MSGSSNNKPPTGADLPTSIKLALLGPPGSGKGSQCVRIKERYPDLCYINPHMMVREEIHRGTPFGLEAQKKIFSGEVISHDTYNSLFLERARSAACAKGYILDGMPTEVKQAEALVKQGEEFDAVFFLDMSDETVMRRTSGRWVHQRSGRIYHDTFARPKAPGYDDETGERLTQRADDSPVVAQQRLDAYKKNAAALREYWSVSAGEHKRRLKEAAEAAKKAAAKAVSADDATPPASSSDATPAADASSTAAEPMVEGEPSYKPEVFCKRLPRVATVDAEGGMETVRGRVFAALDEAIKEKHARVSRGGWWKFW